MKKIYDLKAVDVDSKQKSVKIAFAQMEDVDNDNDIFDIHAFDKSIKERGPQGTNEIWHLLDHTTKSFSALSKFKEIYTEGKYLIGVSMFKNSFAWREVAWPLYEAGDFTQHSIGFETIDSEKRKDGVRIIKDVRIYEGSAVLWGAQPDTPTVQVAKALLNIEDDTDITASEKIEELVKKIYKGRFDEDQSLLVIELKRLQYLFDSKNIVSLFSKSPQNPTEPEITTTLPETRIKKDWTQVLNILIPSADETFIYKPAS